MSPSPRTRAALNYLEQTLPFNSHVLFVGLVDGRVLWDTMSTETHRTGATGTGGARRAVGHDLFGDDAVFLLAPTHARGRINDSDRCNVRGLLQLPQLPVDLAVRIVDELERDVPQRRVGACGGAEPAIQGHHRRIHVRRRRSWDGKNPARAGADGVVVAATGMWMRWLDRTGSSGLTWPTLTTPSLRSSTTGSYVVAVDAWRGALLSSPPPQPDLRD